MKIMHYIKRLEVLEDYHTQPYIIISTIERRLEFS